MSESGITPTSECSSSPSDAELIEADSSFDASIPLAVYAREAALAARDRHRLMESEAAELLQIIDAMPRLDESGLSAAQSAQFVTNALQCVEYCLLRLPARRPGFINKILQSAVDEYSYEGSWKIVEINDEGRRGRSRTKTLGQIQRLPGNPNDPSFLGGSWEIRRGAELRRVVFSLESRAVAETLKISDVLPRHLDEARCLQMVTARGPRPWTLQVDAHAPLGQWIARLAGTCNIGQHCGHLALGVFCEAVQRKLESNGLSHFLLGASRRDPPTRPWHTGQYLRRIDDGFVFRWTGLALADGARRLVRATTDVEAIARIITVQNLTSSGESDLP
ncbi:MAG: hypothetical protein ACKVX7_01990 [Planctomycetota bacterium]